jgi:hypothetical protein
MGFGMAGNQIKAGSGSWDAATRRDCVPGVCNRGRCMYAAVFSGSSVSHLTEKKARTFAHAPYHICLPRMGTFCAE